MVIFTKNVKNGKIAKSYEERVGIFDENALFDRSVFDSSKSGSFRRVGILGHPLYSEEAW